MAATLTRTGRPQRPYLASWGEHITGLAYGPDGRWRIVATGERYREPIAIVTLGHKGEIEPPMLFNLRDTRKLAIELLGILAHHGDEKAEKAHDMYVDDSDA